MENTEKKLKIIISQRKSSKQEQELIDNLKSISEDDIKKLADGTKWSEKVSSSEGKELLRESGEYVNGDDGFEDLWEVDWSFFEYEKERKIVKWKWKVFDLTVQSWREELLDEVTWIMREKEIQKAMDILGEIYGVVSSVWLIFDLLNHIN